MVIGLVLVAVLGVQCSPGVVDRTNTVEQSPIPPLSPTSPAPLPTDEPIQANPTPTIAPDRASATPTSLPAVDQGLQPPVDVDNVPPVPAQAARFDLARRLRLDARLISVVEITTQVPSPKEMPCLAGGLLDEDLSASGQEVQWITLSAKGKIYHYVALRDLIVYCEE
jgi:hypothetical protein